MSLALSGHECRRLVGILSLRNTDERHNSRHWIVRILLVLLFFCAGGLVSEAKANCSFAPLYGGPTNVTFGGKVSIPANAKVGDVLYDQRMNFTFIFAPNWFNCDSGSVPGSNTFVFRQECVSDPCPTNTTGIGFKVFFENSTTIKRTQIQGKTTYVLPDGVLSSGRQTESVRLQFIVTSLPVISRGPIRDLFSGDSALAGAGITNTAGQFLTVLTTASVIPTTCAMDDFTVNVPPIMSSQFTGIGSTRGRRNFNVALRCSQVQKNTRIGLSFGSIDKDDSNAPGVIKVRPGTGAASGIALQIINQTTGQPISFDTFEPGRPNTATDGVFNNPYSVQYYQTKDVVTAGQVRGQAVVTITYR